MNEHEHTGLSELPIVLRSAVEGIVAEPISEDEMRRSLARVHAMHRPVVLKHVVTPFRALVLSSLAAALLLGFWILHLSSHSAWAEVVKSVADRAWLHGSGKVSNGQSIEFWYSASKRIMASKMGNQLSLLDAQQEVIETYVLDATPPSTINRMKTLKGNFDRLEIFQTILDGKIGKLSPQLGAGLIEQTHQQVTVDGKLRDEYRFVIAERSSGLRNTSTFLVDPESKLPIRWELESQASADKATGFRASCELDYPDSGPETIYSLGAPHSAEVVDNVPRGDLKRIIEGLKQGRARFDNYRGIVVTSSRTPIPNGRGPAICYQVWRKGLKWRIEQCQVKGEDRLPPNVDPQNWWTARAANSPVVLKSLSDGKDHCTLSSVYAQPHQPNPDNPRYLKIDSFTKQVRPIYEPTDPWMIDPSWEMPEIVGRLNLMGEFTAEYETTVHANPDRGPAGCVLVEMFRRDNHPSTLFGRRYWVDPTRDYLVMLDEILKGTRDNFEVAEGKEITKVAQSPTGRWYPTQLRVIGGTVSGDGTKSDYFNNYYLDFEAEVPDELFEIPK